jgi:hypothetical protein
MVVVEVETVDLVIATMKAQAQAQDLVTPKRPYSWTTQYLRNSKQELYKEKPQENIARRDDYKVLKFVSDFPLFISASTCQ